MPMEATPAQVVAMMTTPAGVLYGMDISTGLLPVVAAVVPVASAAQPVISVPVAPAVAAAVAVPAVALIGKILVIIMRVPLAAKAVKMLMEVTLPMVKKPR